MTRSRILFVAKFLGIVAALYVLIALPAVDAAVVQPFTSSIARTAGAILHAFDRTIVVNGTVITSRGAAVNVQNGCNGVEAMILLVAAIVAFPASAKKRAAGAAAGIVVIQVVNLVRVVTLFILARDFPQYFETFHVVVWQTVIFLIAVGIFIAWSARVAESSPDPA